MQNPIYIVLSSDDNYAQHMGVVALSLLKNAKQPQRLFFFFLDAGIKPLNQERLSQVVREYGAGCEFIRPGHESYAAIPWKRYGVAALFRLSLGSLLPAEVERVIYLDCDVLAFDDIEKLWATELEENIVGAVTNLGRQSVARLEIADGEYFNSGVLLIDLEKWRRERVGEETLAFMLDNIEQLIFPDQDGLNRVLQGRWHHLPLRWNQQPASYSMYQKGRRQAALTAEEFAEAVQNPAIVHYLGRNKPWNYMTFHPLKESYWNYLAQSPWRGACPENLTLGNRVKKALMLEKQLKRWQRRLATPLSIRRKGV